MTRLWQTASEALESARLRERLAERGIAADTGINLPGLRALDAETSRTDETRMLRLRGAGEKVAARFDVKPPRRL